MAVFDIDDTILEASQRFKDARRAGLIDKDGKPVKKRAIETPGKAFKRKEDFLYDPKNLQKDKIVPGALEFIQELMAEGYVIAYCTGRLYTHREVTRAQLESKGFPIMRDAEGEELLFLNSRRGTSTRNYKLQTLTTLKSKYDIRMFFDDQTDNLSSAASVGIPGIYAKISDYTKYKTRSNPEEYIIREGSDEEEERDTLDPSGYGFYGSVPKNPGSIESKVQAILIKEGGAAGLKPLKAAFPKGTTKAQAIAAIAEMPSVYQHPAGDYILKDETVRANGLSLADTLRELEEEKEDRRMGGRVPQQTANEYFSRRGNPGHSGNYMVPRDIHRLGKAADRLEETYEDGLDTPEWWKSKLSVTAKDADTIADSLDYVANNPADVLPIMSGEPTGQHKKLGAVFSEVFIGRNVVKDVGEVVQGIYRGLVGGRTSMAEKRMAMAIASMQKELSDRAKALGGNAVANLKVDYEMVQGTASLTIIGTADAVKMRSPPKKNPIPLNISVQVKGYRNTAGAFVMKGEKFLILQRSKKETSKHGLWELPGGKVEKGETMRETAIIETQEEAGLDVTLKVNLGSHIDDKKKKVYHAFMATPKKGQKVKLSFEHSAHKWVTPEEVMAMPKKMVSHHLLHFLKKESETIRSNPPKNKIEKGKKLYEHMNGKAPEKVEKKKIDMGDVWYQVGEGGCWQIGYMSGKETGKTEQKYTHTFNEETQDGNFPKLYATMPENGKPMLIITGGTWKIRTDDKGVAWIYD